MDDFINTMMESINKKFVSQSPIMENLYHKLQNDEKALKFNRITCEITGAYKLAIVTSDNIFTVLLNLQNPMQIVEVSCESSIIFPLKENTVSIDIDYTNNFFNAIEQIKKELEASEYDNIINMIREHPEDVILGSNGLSILSSNEEDIEIPIEDLRNILFRLLKIEN